MASRFSKRERTVITIGIVLLVIAAVTPFVRGFFRDYNRSESLVREARERLEFSQQLRSTLEAERSGQRAIDEQVKQRAPRFDLYSFTSAKLSELKLDNRYNLESIRGRDVGDQLDGVQLRLNGVSMKEFVDLLYALDASKNLIIVRQLNELRPARDGNGLDCLVTFVSPKSA